MDGLDKMDKPVSPIMPIMGELVADAIPVPVPQMQWDAGMLRNFFHNVKYGQMAKAAGYEATIAISKDQATSAKANSIKTIVTLSADIENTFDSFRHNKVMRATEEETAKANLINVQLDNQLKLSEVKLNNLEVEIKTKQLAEMLHGTPTS